MIQVANQMMSYSKPTIVLSIKCVCFGLVVVVFFDLCSSNPTGAALNDTTAQSARKNLEEMALNTYRTACLRLQQSANWMSVLFKLLGAWKNTRAKSMVDNARFKIEREILNVPLLPERPMIAKDGLECSSLRSLHVTLQTYVHFQAQLLQLKVVLGSLAFKSGKSRLDEARAFIQERIGSLDVLNETAVEIFDVLRKTNILMSNGTKAENEKNSSDVNDFKLQTLSPYNQDGRSDTLLHIKENIESFQNPKMAEKLFQVADFLRSLGQPIDMLVSTSKTTKQDDKETTTGT